MLDWDRFKSLPGAATDNFEKLCRCVVSRHYGFHGPLMELKNQPGVEYHIELSKDDSRLGAVGQIVGWQCKWFQYRANGHLTSGAKAQVEHSLQKTVEHVPNLAIWILWTHKILAKEDQAWFYGLKDKYGFELRLWNEGDLDNLLSGPAIDLRHSYFGDLALTHEVLAEQHDISVAPVKSRWLKAVHQTLDVERAARQILGEPCAWEDFEKYASALTETSKAINSIIDDDDYQPWRTELAEFVDQCELYVKYCNLFDAPIFGEHLEQINELVVAASYCTHEPIRRALRVLRRRNLPLSLVLTNGLAYIKDIKGLLEEAHDLLSQQLIAVVADAGGGKTQFSAELTSQSEARPAGVLLLGRDLNAGATLDSLAQRISFFSQIVPTFESLLAALDAVGTRAGCRLPIVIDGLNEAQDPRDWKALLESAQPALKKYPNVVLVCTLRTGERERPHHLQRAHSDNSLNSRESFAQHSLPENCFSIESEGFSEAQTAEAIKAYFNHYKIAADPFMAPLSFFSHPLNLKIFCEVTNRTAQNIVRITHFPSSIYSLFGEQIQHSAKTISDMTSLAVRYRSRDIEDAIYFLGATLWEGGKRFVEESQFREAFNIESPTWDSDIVNLLVQEGLIFRDELARRTYKLSPVYDRLGGYFIAYHLLEAHKDQDLSNWTQSEDFLQKLFGDIPLQHELSQDILFALVVLAPKYRKGHIWQAVPSDYMPRILSLSHLIDASDICAETIRAYKNKILEEKLPRSAIEKLLVLKTAVAHPFNADFLSDVLAELTIVDRDLSWTEYNRFHTRDLIRAISNRVEIWRSGQWGNGEVERLRTLSISWLLTSSCIELRDIATEALFYYGLSNPETFFIFSSRLLTVDDMYVSERLLAASYGVVGSLLPKGEGAEEIARFAKFLYLSMFIEDAEAATTHLLAREYASCIIRIVSKYIPELFTDSEVKNSLPPFPEMPRNKWGEVQEETIESRVESPFRMDFENYTIGRLVSDRGNYDYDHPEYKKIKNQILWRVNDLGWNGERFSDVEKLIESGGGYSRAYRPKVERYGKKYSLIAYYEMAGELEDKGKLDPWSERFAADIDPFFPRDSLPNLDMSTIFLGDASTSTENWIGHSELPNLDGILTAKDAGGFSGDWVLLDGYIVEESKRLDRSFYCSIRNVFIKSSDRSKVQGYIENENQIDWPELLQTSYIYSGELYEDSKFSAEDNDNLKVTVGYEKKKVERPQFMLNGKVIAEGGTVVFDAPVYDEVTVRIPVMGYHWESSIESRSGASRVVLAPWVFDRLGLTFDATDFSYLDKDGELAAVFFKQKSEDTGSYKELFYLRKDLVETLLEGIGLKVIFKARGERRLLRTEHFHSNKGVEVKYKDFEFITHFPM